MVAFVQESIEDIKKWLSKHEEKGCKYPKECECIAVREFYVIKEKVLK